MHESRVIEGTMRQWADGYPDTLRVYVQRDADNRCTHCGDSTEPGDDPAPDLCAMCERAGRGVESAVNAP